MQVILQHWGNITSFVAMVNYNFGVLDMGLGSRPSQLIFVIFSQKDILAAQNDAVLLSDQINSKKYIFHYISSKK